MRDSQRDAADNRLARLLVRQGDKQVRLTQTTVAGGGGSDERTRDSFINPMTSEGDMIVGDATGSPQRLAVGTDGDVLTADSGAPNGVAWVTGGGGSYSDEQAQDAIGTILTDSTSIDFTYSDATPSITASVILEWLQDTVAAMFTGGTDSGITVTYQDASGTIDLTVSGGGGYTDEQVRDVIGAALVAGNNIDITVNDGADTITIDVESLTSADITDFSEAVDDRVSALIVAGNNIDVTYNDVANTLTIDAEALTASDVTDFSEAVDDRVASLVVAGNNIDVTYNDGANTLTIDVESLTSADITDFTEAVQDVAGAAIVAGNNIDVTYNDGAGTITVDVESLTSADITDFTEAAQDAVGAALTDSSSIDFTYNDGANTITAAVIDEAIQDIVGAMAVDSSSINFTYTDGSNQITADVIDSYITDLVGTGSAGEGGASDITEWLHHHRWGQNSVSAPGAAGVATDGIMSGGTSAGTTSNSDDADGMWITHVSSTGTGQAAGRAVTPASYRADWGMTFVARMKTGSDITSVRYWYGMSNGTLTAADTPTVDTAGFRASTGVPDTNWKAVTCDNTGCTVTDTGVSFAANAAHWFRVHFGTSKANFYIDDVLVASHSTANGDKLPSTNGLGWWARLITLANVTRSLKYGSVSLSTLN